MIHNSICALVAFDQQESPELKKMLNSLNFSYSCLPNYISFSDLPFQTGKSPIDVVLFSISGRGHISWVLPELEIALGKRLLTIFWAGINGYEAAVRKETLTTDNLIWDFFDADVLGRTIECALTRVQVKLNWYVNRSQLAKQP